MSTYPAWLAGQRITAAKLIASQEQLAYKTTSTPRTSTTTIANDPDLTLAVEANAIYSLEGLLVYNGGSTNDDLRMGWAAPASASLTWVATGQGLTASTGIGTVVTDAQDLTSNAYSLGTIANTRGMTAMIRGLLITAGTAGFLTLQWAQFTSSATATSMLAGSHIGLQRLG
ncbi:hypothetical protein [Peterkaempfera sp. SMS 1(5)a]|uniref:hypothetical protein n=1 Tax=Peterkaempfera podocarpi TaxID=3232308 RepID=UPI0036732193